MAIDKNNEDTGENLPSEEEVLYYLNNLDDLYKGLGRLSSILDAMIGGGQEMKHLYPEHGLVPLETLKAAVDAARPDVAELALEIQANSLETQNGQTP